MRNLVIEHNILTCEGEKLPSIILDGTLWGEDFENLASKKTNDPITYNHTDGFSKTTNQPVTYSQTFIRTEKTNEQLLKEMETTNATPPAMNYHRTSVTNLSFRERLEALHNQVGDGGICEYLYQYLDDEEVADFITWIEDRLEENDIAIPYPTYENRSLLSRSWYNRPYSSSMGIETASIEAYQTGNYASIEEARKHEATTHLGLFDQGSTAIWDTADALAALTRFIDANLKCELIINRKYRFTELQFSEIGLAINSLIKERQ